MDRTEKNLSFSFREYDDDRENHFEFPPDEEGEDRPSKTIGTGGAGASASKENSPSSSAGNRQGKSAKASSAPTKLPPPGTNAESTSQQQQRATTNQDLLLDVFGDPVTAPRPPQDPFHGEDLFTAPTGANSNNTFHADFGQFNQSNNGGDTSFGDFTSAGAAGAGAG